MKLWEVRLLVNDFDTCFRFYRDVIGLPVTWGKEGDGYAAFDMNGPTTLAMMPRKDMAAVVGAADTENPPGNNHRVVISLEVDDVDAMTRTLQERGATLVVAPTDRAEWGIRVAHFHDPEGTLIEIGQRLPSA